MMNTTKERNCEADELTESLFLNQDETYESLELPEEREEGDGPRPVRAALVGNSADKEQVERAENIIMDRARQEELDMQWLLSDVRGRRFLWRYMEKTKPLQTEFIGDTSELQFTLGQRNVGSNILADILSADSTALSKMMQEFKGEVNGNRNKRKRKSDAK